MDKRISSKERKLPRGLIQTPPPHDQMASCMLTNSPIIRNIGQGRFRMAISDTVSLSGIALISLQH